MILTIASAALLSAIPAPTFADAYPVPSFETALHLSASDTAGEPKQAKKESSADDIVCKRETVTGSFAKRVKTCMTRRQWLAIAQESKRQGEELQDHALINTTTR